TFKDVRVTAMDKLVDRLKAEAEANDGAVWVLKNARFAVFCILLSMCFGVEMDEKTVEEIDDMMKTVLITLDPRLDDYLPLLKPLFSKQRKRAMEVREPYVRSLLTVVLIPPQPRLNGQLLDLSRTLVFNRGSTTK
ncbi:cytochrome P450 77A2-like protein, partial [Tanacetum coccineum]